jgi:hypothetical protein
VTINVREAGRGSISWNGRIGRKLAPRGVYKLIVKAVTRTGASVRRTVTVRIG